MNSREYINDPDGTILSPPIMKDHPAKSPSPKREQVGRHTVLLDARTFQVNANTLNFIDYAAAYAFFQEVIKHENILDEVDDSLSNGCQDGLFYSTSDWQFEIGGIRLHGYRLY
jgi:hypothetical protein